jgi:hypothetical protein
VEDDPRHEEGEGEELQIQLRRVKCSPEAFLFVTDRPLSLSVLQLESVEPMIERQTSDRDSPRVEDAELTSSRLVCLTKTPKTIRARSQIKEASVVNPDVAGLAVEAQSFFTRSQTKESVVCACSGVYSRLFCMQMDGGEGAREGGRKKLTSGRD